MTPESDSAAGAELARLYDLDLVEEQPDLDLYLALAATAEGPTLELAAGTGRICVPLAAAGHEVTAVDRDADMLARAAGRWALESRRRGHGSLELVQADLITLQLDRQFGLVILAFNTLLLLPGRDAQLAALRSMARHLLPAGKAVVDAWLPAPDDLALYDGRLQLDWVRPDPEAGELVAKVTSADYRPATATATVRTFFDSWPATGGPVRRRTREDELHFIAPTELLALVERAGMAAGTIAGDYALNPLGSHADRVVLVCGLL